MILCTNKIIKEISYELGFQSVYYFSRAFKNKMGVSPIEIRHCQKRIGKVYSRIVPGNISDIAEMELI
jgi:AraC-like DNA-binding protein